MSKPGAALQHQQLHEVGASALGLGYDADRSCSGGWQTTASSPRALQMLRFASESFD